MSIAEHPVLSELCIFVDLRMKPQPLTASIAKVNLQGWMTDELDAKVLASDQVRTRGRDSQPASSEKVGAESYTFVTTTEIVRADLIFC